MYAIRLIHLTKAKRSFAFNAAVGTSWTISKARDQTVEVNMYHIGKLSEYRTLQLIMFIFVR